MYTLCFLFAALAVTVRLAGCPAQNPIGARPQGSQAAWNAWPGRARWRGCAFADSRTPRSRVGQGRSILPFRPSCEKASLKKDIDK